MKRESWIAITFMLLLGSGGAVWLALNASNFADPGAPSDAAARSAASMGRAALAPPLLEDMSPNAAELQTAPERNLFTPISGAQLPQRFERRPDQPLSEQDAAFMAPVDTVRSPASLRTPFIGDIPPGGGTTGGDAPVVEESPRFQTPPPPGVSVHAVFPDSVWLRQPQSGLDKFVIGDTLMGWRVAVINDAKDEVILERGDMFSIITRIP